MKLILMLEDEWPRIKRFQRTVEGFPDLFELKIWRSAIAMIEECDPFLDHAALISLDHDLYPDEPDSDWGDGVQVAKFLAERPPKCPVLVHSSNVQCARWMIGEFELAGWDYERVAPIGKRWIEEFWAVVAKEKLGIK